MTTPGLLVPSNGGWVTSGMDQLVRDVRAGLPLIGWAGDPDLEVRIGELREVTASGPTGRAWRRIEVWFTPTNECVGVWEEDEKDRVCHDLAQMDKRVRGHVDFMDRIQTANDAVHQKAVDQHADSMGALKDHLGSIAQDTVIGKNTFRGVGGLRDRTDIKR